MDVPVDVICLFAGSWVVLLVGFDIGLFSCSFFFDQLWPVGGCFDIGWFS